MIARKPDGAIDWQIVVGYLLMAMVVICVPVALLGWMLR